MKPIYQSFNKNTDMMVGNPVNRARIIAAALAKAMCDLCPLPTSPVEGPSSYFNLQVLPALRPTVSDWNENMVFDARSCVDLIRAFWLLRYTAAHPISRPVYALDKSFFESIMGVGTFIASDTAVFFEENKQAILFLSTCAAEIANRQMNSGQDNG